MSLRQSLLCALVFYVGTLSSAFSMAGEAVNGLLTAAPGKELTIVSYFLDLTSAEAETVALWTEDDRAGGSVAEVSPAGEGFRDEFSSSTPAPSWNAGVTEQPSLPSDSSSPDPLPIAGTGGLDEIGAFVSLPQAWVSPGTRFTLSGHIGKQAVPSGLPTGALFTRPGLAADSPDRDSQDALGDSIPTTESDQQDSTEAPSSGTSAPDLPTTASDFPTTVPATQPLLPSPQLPPNRTVLGGSVATDIGREGPGFIGMNPEHPPWLEGPSKGPGSASKDATGTRPTTAKEEAQGPKQQVTCRDWSKLAGKNYVILNLTENTECEVFRTREGLKLLKLVAQSFSRKLSTPADSWLISLSKPSEDEKHLLMMLASDRGTIPAKEVLMMLGEVKENLKEIGIHNVTSAAGCQGRPSHPRGDYGKLFVVLVIIGSICAVIIVSGLVYICWQRRLPKLKNMSHGEELHFVENGCHDNPTLDITIDSTSEMQEKKPSVNGDAVECSGGWSTLITKGSKDEPDSFEEDTHL
ncbi:podocalyxin-like protein 2 isoform X1 [Rhincodon typus]|uniref:podocalyxin-like protein 2 isoform X1 n=1 Tax=Rhincodon typus TaxID=259920 RepID=UPI00202E45E3|nr:podocalyxin-like protein 2 isoform X1 [Rhincodon typus]